MRLAIGRVKRKERERDRKRQREAQEENGTRPRALKKKFHKIQKRPAETTETQTERRFFDVSILYYGRFIFPEAPPPGPALLPMPGMLPDAPGCCRGWRGGGGEGLERDWNEIEFSGGHRRGL